MAVATGGLERRFVETALRLLGWSVEQGNSPTYWLGSSAKLRTLLGVTNGLNPEFDALTRELDTAWSHRNEIVHVSTGWNDWENPDDPSGWHYEHPRTGARVYLTNETKEALEGVLASISALHDRVWELHQSLTKPA